jgi:hypothetical protein
MKLSPSYPNLQIYKELLMKRVLLVLGSVVLFLSTLVTPTAVKADGGAGATNCGGQMCKPLAGM